MLRELRLKIICIAKHVLINEHLTIATVTCADAYSKGRNEFGNLCCECSRNAFKGDGEGTSLANCLSIGDEFPCSLKRLALNLIASESVKRLRGESDMGNNRNSCLNDSFEQRCTTVGRDYPFVEVKVLDPETNEECPVGVQGEMCCRGFNVMKGYYKNPTATAEVIDKNGFLHSGDLGVKDEDGFYKITGRIKDMSIRGGENIYPREIEEFLYHMPGIRDVQVAAVPSKKYGEAVGAFIILEEGVKMTPEDVQLFCRGKIARYKIPKYVFFIKEFPLTGSGKIQKFKLKEMSLKLCEEQGIEVV